MSLADQIPTCSYEDCGRPLLARNYCTSHYSQWRAGKPLRKIRKRGMSIEDRFDSYIDKSGECWEWTGGKLKVGYGTFYVSRHDWCVRAHRFAFERANGPIPPELEVDHICHNRGCVHPKHLRLTTRKQNMENLSGARADSASGARGVSYRKKSGTWQAYVRHNGKQLHLGYYATIDEAAAVAAAKRNELFTHNELDRINAEATV